MIPQRRQSIDWTPLQKFIEDEVQKLDNDERSKDFEYYVFEEAVKCMYGAENFFKWYNELEER